MDRIVMPSGTIIEFSPERGFGVIELESGTTVSFDVSACPKGVPAIGERVEVEVATRRFDGKPYARRVAFTGPPTARELPGLLAKWGLDVGMAICLDEGEVTRIAFNVEAWREPNVPRFGASVVCTQSFRPLAYAARGWASNAATHVVAAPISADAHRILSAHLPADGQKTFPSELTKSADLEVDARADKPSRCERGPSIIAARLGEGSVKLEPKEAIERLLASPFGIVSNPGAFGFEFTDDSPKSSLQLSWRRLRPAAPLRLLLVA
jgi:hypothetical protein